METGKLTDNIRVTKNGLGSGVDRMFQSSDSAFYSTDYVNCPSTYEISFLLTFFLFCYFGCSSCYEISLWGFKEKNKDER